MQITGLMLAQLLQTGKLKVGGVELALDPTLDFVRRFGKISVDFKIDSEPKSNIMFENIDPIRGKLWDTCDEGSYTTASIKSNV